MSLLKLTIDRQKNRLVSLNGTVTELPALFQYNLKDFQIQVVDPSNDVIPTYSAIDLLGSSLRVGIWTAPTGTAGGPSSLALQTTWTWDATNKWFTGSLDLAAAALESAIGSSTYGTFYFEVTLVTSGNRQTLYQSQIVVKAVGDEGTTTAPASADQYFPKAESDARYVKKVMDNGGVIVIPDSNGVYALELGCNDDGTVKMNIITL